MITIMQPCPTTTLEIQIIVKGAFNAPHFTLYIDIDSDTIGLSELTQILIRIDKTVLELKQITEKLDVGANGHWLLC